MPCKLCHRDEPRCDPERLIICSRCFQILLRSTPEQIKKAHSLAIQKGYTEKAEALMRFIQKGDVNGKQTNVRRKPRYIAKHFDRGRDSKINRPYKKSVGPLPEQEAVPVSPDQPELQAIS